MVINGVRVLRSGPHTPTQFSGSTPPGIDTATVYLDRFTSCTCHCLWKYGISELSIVHENAICLSQGLLILTNTDMTLLRRILREPVFSRHPVLCGHQQGSRRCLPNTGLIVIHYCYNIAVFDLFRVYMQNH